MQDNSKQKKLEKLLDIFESGSFTYEQGVTFFKALAKAIKENREFLSNEYEKNKKELLKELEKALANFDKKVKEKADLKVFQSELEGIKKKLSSQDSFTKKEVEKIRSLIESLDIPEKFDPSAILEKIEGLHIPTSDEILELVGKQLPMYAMAFRDGLELLQGDDRLGMSAIKGLKEEFESVKQQVASKGGVRRVFQPYIDRFTTQTNGSNKIFYLKREPLRTDTIEVSGTDYPIILDPTVDFTVAGKKLTLTDEVPAPAEGATLIVKYYA